MTRFGRAPSVAAFAALFAFAAQGAGIVAQPIRADDEGFHHDVIALVAPSAPGDQLGFLDDDILELKSSANQQAVYIYFSRVHGKCIKEPAACGADVADFLDDLPSDIASARAIRDKRDANDDSLYAIRSGNRLEKVLTADPPVQAVAHPPSAAAATAGDVPLEPDAFAQYFEHRMQLYTSLSVKPIVAGYLMSVGRPLGLFAQSDRGTQIVFSFAGLHRRCIAAPLDCERLSMSLIESFTASSPAKEPVASDLRAVLTLNPLRYTGYHITFHDGDQRSTIDLFRPSFGNFFEGCRSAASGMRIMRTDLHELKMSADEALALCEANTRSAIGPMSEAYGTNFPADGILMIRGSIFESSRLLLLDQWTPLAQSLGGLLVAAPARDLIIYSRDAPGAAQTLSDRARGIKIQAKSNGLSGSVFRWTKDGWTAVIDGD